MGRIKHILYDDDLQIYIHVAPYDLFTGIRKLGRPPEAIFGWATGALLRLNAGKTKATIFGYLTFVNKIKKYASYKSGLRDALCFPFSDTDTSLGVVLHSTLFWKSHIDQVTKKFNRLFFYAPVGCYFPTFPSSGLLFSVSAWCVPSTSKTPPGTSEFQ